MIFVSNLLHLKGINICKQAASKFRKVLFAMFRITFGYRTRTVSRAPRALIFTNQRYRLRILGLGGVRSCDSGELSFPSCSVTLLYSAKPDGNKRESGLRLMFTATTTDALITWEPVLDRVLNARFRSGMSNISIVP